MCQTPSKHARVQLHPQLHIDVQTKLNANLQDNGTASTELQAV
jgi:hypothetical protein